MLVAVVEELGSDAFLHGTLPELPGDATTMSEDIIARVDPVATGLLRRGDTGELVLAQDPPRVEGHINHLSDHDFIFSGDSASRLIASLSQLAPRYGIDPAADPPRFNQFRNLVLAQAADMRLYGVLQTGGLAGLQATLDALDLSPLSADPKG